MLCEELEALDLNEGEIERVEASILAEVTGVDDEDGSSSTNELPLHPAADIFRSQLLIEVSEENAQLAKETSHIQALASLDFLTGIEMRLGSGRVISASLCRAMVVQNFHGVSCLCIHVGGSFPLSELRGGGVRMAGQDIGVFPGVAGPFVRVGDDDKAYLTIVFSDDSSVIKGELCGLNPEDKALFKDETYGDEKIADFLTTGQGLRNPEALTFVPQTMFMIITDQLKETIRAIGPLPKYDSLMELDEGDRPLPVDPAVDCYVCPPPSEDEESATTAVALGCSDSQMELFDKNRDLKVDLHRLSKIEDRIGMVELICNTAGQNIASLRDGSVWKGAAPPKMLQMPPQHRNGDPCLILANDIPSLEIAVSGIPSYLESVTISNAGGKTLCMSFGNGAKVVGYVDFESAPEMNMNEFDEIAQGVFSGARSFHPELAVMVTHVHFPLTSIQSILDVLGVSYDD